MGNRLMLGGQTKSFHWILGSVLLGLAVSALIVGALATSLVWLALLIAGLAVVTGSFLARDLKLYWLTVFLLTLPLNIKKMFFYEPEDVAALRRTYDLFINEVEVPLLYLSDLPLLVLLVLWMADALHRRRGVELPKGALLAVGFILWCAVSLVSAPARGLGLVWILNQTKLLILFLWLVNASLSPRALRRVVAVLLFNLATQGALTVWTYARQSGWNIYGNVFGVQQLRSEVRRAPRHAGEGYVYEKGDLLRGSGTVGVGNETAKFLVPLLPLALVSGIFARRASIRLVSFLCFALGSLAIYLTYSRGGMLAALTSTVVLVGLLARRGYVPARARVTWAMVGLALLAGATPALYDYFTSRPGYFDVRLDHLRYGAEILSEHALVGVGINNFNVAVSKHDYGGVFSDMAVHNHYLRVGAETGMPGLLLYLAFFVWVSARAYRGMWHADRFISTTAAALLAGLAATMFYWLDDLFYSVVISTELWLVAGLAVMLGKQLESETTRSFASARLSLGLASGVRV